MIDAQAETHHQALVSGSLHDTSRTASSAIRGKVTRKAKMWPCNAKLPCGWSKGISSSSPSPILLQMRFLAQGAPQAHDACSRSHAQKGCEWKDREEEKIQTGYSHSKNSVRSIKLLAQS
ncbi:hypothetical protein TcCL_ESM02411 [Trypanosoma cruzi]|nr:hypothetical protein TcCL_ESM02411 [Trypanosoma cruzi]